MSIKKRVITVIVTVIVIAALGFGGWLAWKKFGGTTSSGKAYVMSVADCNTATGAYLSTNRFAGIVESQKTADVDYDSSKTIKEIYVKEGDEVAVGDKLFSYDVEAMQLQLEQGNIEVERLNNDIDSYNKQIEQLEEEKKKATSDMQVSYTTQIQSLETDISKAEYDIKAKNVELEKLQKSIDNCDVLCEMAGTVKTVNDPSASSGDDSYYDSSSSSNALITIMASGDYRVKGKINEQNMGEINEGEAVIIRSRLDSSVTWKGTVSGIESEPEKNNDYYYGDSDESTTSSNYPFYIELESTENLMLGQHVIIEPDLGTDEEKDGIWLYEDYLVQDGDSYYVWADNNGKLEKREVEVGEHDEEVGDCEIKSGLKNSDMIAYPASNLTEGMTTTTNIEDTESYADGLGGDDYDNEEDYEGDYEGDDEITFEDMGISFDEDGNPIDSEGNIISDEDFEAIVNEMYGYYGDEEYDDEYEDEYDDEAEATDIETAEAEE